MLRKTLLATVFLAVSASAMADEAGRKQQFIQANRHMSPSFASIMADYDAHCAGKTTVEDLRAFTQTLPYVKATMAQRIQSHPDYVAAIEQAICPG